MYRKFMLVLVVLLVSLVAVVPALAAAPLQGTVVEGVSVPGIALGDTRAQVQTAYGEPNSCQSGSVGGDASYCQYPVEGGGQVGVHFRGPDGSGPSNSPDDVATGIRWFEQVSGWTTTAGVNTTLAKQDPEAVVAATGEIVELLGYSHQEVLSWSAGEWFGTVHQPDLANQLNQMWRGLVGQVFKPGALPEQIMEYPLVRKDGSVVDCRTVWRAVQDPSGAFKGLEIVIETR